MRNYNLKTIFTLAALAMSLAIASAQETGSPVRKTSGTIGKGPVAERVLVPGAAMARAPRAGIRMDGDERLMGFYTTDDLPGFSNDGYIRLGFLGSHPLAALFEEDVIGNFVGGEITRFRFAVACDVEVHNAFIYTAAADMSHISGEPSVLVDIESTLGAGWHDVELPTPLAVEDGTNYLIGFEYEETSGKYPIATDGELDPDFLSDWGIMAYGDFGYGYAWYSFGNYYGSPCVQAVVRGGNFIDEDITLKNLSVSKGVEREGMLYYDVDVRNSGNAVPGSYVLKVAIDGSVVDTLDTPVALATSFRTVSGTLVLDEDLPAGDHVLSVTVDRINGNVPVYNTGDDTLEASFIVYEGSVERQRNLVEHFTSVRWGNCPLGDAVLGAMMESHPDKYALVSIHGSLMGEDPYCLEDGSSEYIEGYVFCDAYPEAAFNRCFLTIKDLGVDNLLAMRINYSDAGMAAALIDDAVDRACERFPAFVGVDISTAYDEDSRELSIKVSGEGVSAARRLLDGNLLTVYLTEDGLEGTQEDFASGDSADGYMVDYTHDHVLRMIASGHPWGDPINWTSETGYENDIVVTLGEGWNWENMSVVALVSGPMVVDVDGIYYYGEESEAYVSNANVLRLADGSTVGVKSPANGGKAFEVSRCAVDGRRLSNPVRGVNIVRMSDGSARKVVVR